MNNGVTKNGTEVNIQRSNNVTKVNTQRSSIGAEVNIQLNDDSSSKIDLDSLLDENENSTGGLGGLRGFGGQGGHGGQGGLGGLAKLSVTSENSDGGDARGRARLRKGGESGTSGNMLEVQYPDTRRAKSPVTVQEWVAALPDIPGDTDLTQPENTGTQDIDNLLLGAEAGCIETVPVSAGVQLAGSAGVQLQGSGSRLTTASVSATQFRQNLRSKEKRNLLMHSDTNASLNSEHSILSTSSVDSVLQSREADPEEVLRNLGFGYINSPLARIPSRFFSSKSQARGVDMDTFLRTEEELEERYRTSHLGYRGLVGNSSRRPSEIVEKIIEALRDKEKGERTRRSSNQSWGNVSNSMLSSNIPARFRVMDPNRQTFESIVEQVTHPEKAAQARTQQEPATAVNTKSFKTLARSVLSVENREWIQRNEARKIQERKRIYIGGKSFIVDEDGNEIPDSEVSPTTTSMKAATAEAKSKAATKEANNKVEHGLRDILEEDGGGGGGGGHSVAGSGGGNPRRPMKKLTHQDSFISVTSTLSVDSDWSDDERVELEKVFGAMFERGEEYAKHRQMQRLRRRSRKKGGGSRTSGSGAGTPSTISWDGSRLVYSRESSLSDLNLDAINVFHNQLTPTPSLDHNSLPTFDDEPADDSCVFTSNNHHQDTTTEPNNNNDLKTAKVAVADTISEDAINGTAKALNGSWLGSNVDNGLDMISKDATTVLVDFQEESEEGERE